MSKTEKSPLIFVIHILENEFTSKYPYVEWSKIIGMRNKLSHGYFGVDLEIVWEVVKRNIPELKQEIIKIKKDLENEK